MLHKKVLNAIDVHLSGDLKKAKSLYKNLLLETRGEDYVAVCLNLGNIYYLSKEYDEALVFYKKTLKADSTNEKTYYNLAMVYMSLNMLLEAKENFIEAISLKKDYLNAYINLGIVNKKLELYDDAVKCYEKALEINPKELDIYYNYANTLMKKEQYFTALEFFKKGLTSKAKNLYKTYYSIGLIYQHKLDFKNAIENFDKSIELNNKYYDAYFARGTVHLILGDFKKGWIDYSHRWEASNDLDRPDYKVKWYQGENLENKTILVQEEQGFGDNIQFIRYISFLCQKNTTVYLALRKPLQKLFSSIPKVKIVSNSQTLNNIDYFVSLLDLPKLFYKHQEQIQNMQNYISFKKEDIFEVNDTKKINIGFVWKGNPNHKGDKKRNIPLENFKELFELRNCHFYSLQYENSDELDEYFKIYKNIFDTKHLINDFNDTSNIVSKLDLVITIDSSMVHLCGALGIKTFLLLGSNSEWRWLLNKDKSIWYKSIKIFRQGETFVWKHLFKKIILEIKTIKKD